MGKRQFFSNSKIVWFYLLCCKNIDMQLLVKCSLSFTPKVNTLVPGVLCLSRWEAVHNWYSVFLLTSGLQWAVFIQSQSQIVCTLGMWPAYPVTAVQVAAVDDIKCRQHSRICHSLLSYVLPASKWSRCWTWGGSATKTSCSFLRNSPQS